MEENTNYIPLILIVDDISKNLQILGNILDAENYRLAFATSGAETLRMLENICPDIILLDVMMPEMDGYEVCKIIKSNDKTADIPIIFITGKAEQEDLIKGFRAGAVDYITKPFNSEELVTRISTHIELKISRDKLKIYNEELKKLNATKNKFFSIIAHDLRSPFSGFLGLTQLINDDLSSLSRDDLKKIAESMNNAAIKLYNFLENLLEWSKTQMDAINIQFSNNNIYNIFDEIYNISSESLIAKKIKFENNIDRDLVLYCDYHTISTAFRNLISNSVKFTHNNGKITVNQYLSDNNLIISIEDNGTGISEQNLKNIFELDKKVVTIGTNKEKGSGLGLLLVKEFVEKNNGKLTINSQVGKGTIAEITLNYVKK